MKFLHSMIRVKDEEKSLKFYCDFLGLKKGDRVRLEDCYLQYLKDEKTGVEIELTINDDTPKDGYSLGSAFGHFAFECDNLDELSKKADKMGYVFDIESYYLEEVKSNIAFMLDPDGNSIEFIEKVL